MILGPGAPRLRLVLPVIGVSLELLLPPKPPAGPLARRQTAIPLIWNPPARLEHAAATSAPPTRHRSAPPQSRAKVNQPDGRRCNSSPRPRTQSIGSVGPFSRAKLDHFWRAPKLYLKTFDFPIRTLFQNSCRPCENSAWGIHESQAPY